MLRPTAFTLLLLGVLSHPLALLCMEQCKGMMAGDSTTTPVQSMIQSDLRKCCADSPQVTKQWDGKPLPKIAQVRAAQPVSVEVLPIGFSHSPRHPFVMPMSGSPPAESLQVLRI